MEFILTAVEFYSLLTFTSETWLQRKYLACKSTKTMIMNFAMALICSVDVAAKCQRAENAVGPT